jgi:hypothetical protein
MGHLKYVRPVYHDIRVEVYYSWPRKPLCAAAVEGFSFVDGWNQARRIATHPPYSANTGWLSLPPKSSLANRISPRKSSATKIRVCKISALRKFSACPKLKAQPSVPTPDNLAHCARCCHPRCRAVRRESGQSGFASHSTVCRLHARMEAIESSVVRDEPVQKPDLLEPGL